MKRHIELDSGVDRRPRRFAVTAFAGTLRSGAGAGCHRAVRTVRGVATAGLADLPARRRRLRLRAPTSAAGEPPAGTGESGEALDIAVLSPDYAAQPAAKEAIDLFEAAAEANGHTVTVVDTNSDNAAMNAEITTAVSQGVDAIVVAFGTPQEFGDGLADAAEAGIPVFGLDTGGVVEGILVNVTTDNRFLGEQSAQAIIDEIGEGGTVAMIHFDPFEPVRLRAEAARALFEENGVEVVEYVQGDPEDSTGFASAVVGDLLAKYPGGRARRHLGRVGTPRRSAPTRRPSPPTAPRSSSPASTARSSPSPRSPRAATGSPRCARTGR